MNHEPFYILLADDDEVDRLLFSEAFSEVKLKTIVHMVNNGAQLMELLNMKDTRLPDLLFLDLNMPKKNGFECLIEIRDNEKLKHLSVAIYSTSDNEKDMERAFSNGANVYINKPDDFNILKQLLNKAVLTAYQYNNKAYKKEFFLLRL